MKVRGDGGGDVLLLASPLSVLIQCLDESAVADIYTQMDAAVTLDYQVCRIDVVRCRHAVVITSRLSQPLIQL